MRHEADSLLYEFLTHLLDLDDNSSTPVSRSEDRQHKRRDHHQNNGHATSYPPALYEELLELMCRREPGRVVHYLRAHATDPPATYRPDVVLALCCQHGILDAQLHLLEVAGQYGQGFELLSGDLNARIEGYLASLEKKKEEEEEQGDVRLSNVEAGLLVVVQYCQRISR